MKTAQRSQQRGVGTLAISMLLLFAMSIVAFYLNRGLVFEQKTSAAQMQSAKAREIAEAGIEWATGMINDVRDIDTSCTPLAAGTVNQTSFRRRYVMTQVAAGNTNVVPATTIFPGCRITDTGLTTCDCPTAAGTASIGTSVQPSFTVAFSTVASSSSSSETSSIMITSTGCTDHADACRPNSTATANADATATVSVVLRLAPLLRAVPASPLTCGLSCTVNGSYNVTNTEIPTNGILINAGTTISMANGTTTTSLQGMPVQNAMIEADESLSSLASNDNDCSDSNMFKAYFGTTIERYKASPSTKTLSCSSTSSCSSALQQAYTDGWRAFYFTSDLQLSGSGTLGSQNDPVMIVSPNEIKINGTWDVYGMIFSNSADWNDLGTGSSTLHGAQISCAAFRSNGNGTLAYDSAALGALQRLTAEMVRVPGSWRDWQ